MTNRQEKQLGLLDFLSNQVGIIDVGKEKLYCSCDTCRESLVFKTCQAVRDWLLQHENHETRIWVEGIGTQGKMTESLTGEEVGIETGMEHFLEKIEKLQRLAGNNSELMEASSAAAKAKELLTKYQLLKKEIDALTNKE
jgi:hypothetical protein